MHMDTSHLIALQTRLSHEVERLENSKTQKERELRQVWVNGIRKEISDEYKFLGMPEVVEMSDDELFKELGL